MELVEEAWAGQAAFVILGGPSLRDFDWSLLKDKRNIVAINRAFIDVPHADICFSEDIQFFQHFAESLSRFAGLVVYQPQCDEHEKQARAALPTIHILKLQKPWGQKFWSKKFFDGVSYSQTSAIGALNIADLLGADPIYVLGLDCNRARRYETYHESYPAHWRPGVDIIASMKSDLENWAAINLRHKFVVNLNIQSAVDCWPKWDRDSFLRSGLPTSISVPFPKEVQVRFP